MEFPAWDPVLIDIPGLPIDLRWYGLMFVVGFVVGNWILLRLSRAGFFPVPTGRVGDLILYLVLGVILGGRLGYALFYEQHLLASFRIVQVWSGGLSFHGGLLGVAFALWLFARKVKVPFLRVGDCCALAVTPGILAVRIANFINGELYGRVADPVHAPLAMRFPTDPVAMDRMRIAETWTMRDRELCIQVAYGRRTWESVQGQLSQVDDLGRRIDWEAVRPHLDWSAVKEHVPYRHPSQLYEAFGEGVLLGLVLLVLYLATRRRQWQPGAYGGAFLIGYGVARFAVEFYRQPDRQFTSPSDPVGTVLLGMTMGQTLCAAMALAGVLIRVLGRRPAAATPAAGGAA